MKRLRATSAGMVDVLVVDDSEFIRDLVRAICHAHGWTCEAASCLEDARVILRMGQPRVLVLDLHLPDGLGAELASNLRRRKATTVIGLTMQPMDYALQQFAEQDVHVVLDKEVVLRHELAEQLSAFLQ